MDDKVKQLLNELGHAISDAVSGSDTVESLLEQLKQSGFDAKLILQAVILVENQTKTAQAETESIGEESFSDDDRRFLKLMKIDL